MKNRISLFSRLRIIKKETVKIGLGETMDVIVPNYKNPLTYIAVCIGLICWVFSKVITKTIMLCKNLRKTKG